MFVTTLELKDRRGKKAMVSKYEKVRYLQNNIMAYQDQAWGEGEILRNYRCTPGVPVDHYDLGYKTIILISRREDKNRGEEDEYRIQWGIRRGFTRSMGYWATEISHHTQRIRVQVIFPPNRPPMEASILEKNRQHVIALRRDSISQLANKKWTLRWKLYEPMFLSIEKRLSRTFRENFGETTQLGARPEIIRAELLLLVGNMLSFLSPDPTILQLNLVHAQEQQVELTMEVIQPWAVCPACHHPSIRVHSAYLRTVADLPAGGCRVKIYLTVRRFFCDQPTCPKRTFTERIPTVVAPYARKTIRLVQAQSRIGFAIGGEAGSRIAADLALPASPDTFLRTVRKYAEPSSPPVKYLGVDDWAFRKRISYGTLLVNLETRRPVDLLPDRTAQTLATWLRSHPEVQLVTRDRFPAYSEGIRQAAPNAIQVTDRWHLVHNLTDAVERILSQHYPLLRATFQETVVSVLAPAGPIPETTHDPPKVDAIPCSPGQAERSRQIHREKKLAQFQEVKRLAARGMGIREIRRSIHLS